MTRVAFLPTNGCFHPTGVYVILSCVTLALIIIFLLGVGNFALHRAVLESGSPVVEQMPKFVHRLGRRLTLVAEFLVLLVALLLAANGWQGLAWGYLAYSVLNGIAAWVILSGRI